ncbi:MAG: ATP-grasp domain-containing protein [Nanoarchaeota archaeon]
MNNINWVVEKYDTEEQDRLIESINKQGYNLTIIEQDKPNDVFVEAQKHIKKCTIFKGTLRSAKNFNHILRPEGGYPGAYYTEEKYNCSNYYQFYGNYLLNEDYIITTLKDLKRRAFFYYGIFGRDTKIFIRPDSGEKKFTGFVLDLLDLGKFEEENENDKSLIIISSPKQIRGEYRFVVSKDFIIAHSTYIYQENITKIKAVPKEAIDFCEKMLKIYIPDSVYCIDIAETMDGDMKLLEINSFASSGLYACDMDKVVEEVSKIAFKEYNFE